MLARRRAAAERGMREAVAEFQRTMVLYAKRLAAARLIQAAWKGFLVRREVRPLLRLAMQRTRQRQAAVAIQKTYRRHLAVKALQARKAALATISRYVPVFRARMRLFAARALTRRRHCAATVVQSYVHMWLAQRLRRTLLKGFTRLQALWRGHQARRRCGRSMAEVRRKLRAASEAGAQAPHKHIGVRLREAIGVLLAKKEPEKVSQPMMCVERFCQVSRACCKVVASDPSTLSELLRHLRRCNRSKPHEPTLHSLLGVLSAVCRYADLLPAVFRADDCVETLSEKLQMFRDTEEVFLPTVSILHRLLSVKLHAVEIASKPEPLRTWEGIAQVLSRKMESERKYLERLEVRKGSDNAAKQSTNKVITAAKALHELQHLISLAIQAQAGGTAPPSALAGGAAAAGPSDKHAHHHPAEGATAGGAGAGAKRLPAYVEPVPAELVQPAAWQAKNTLVRDALKEITTRHHLQAAQATASAAAMAAAVAAGGGDPVVLLSLTAPLAPALAATGDAAGSSVQKGQQQLGGLGSPHRKKSPRAQAK